MLNRIIVINSELYAKASIHIGSSASIQITAENNVGKSSFLNTLNFLYITEKDDMRFEDKRKLSDSMKHYFDGTSLHSFIIFEISKNGHYCILVKATPENTIEYYKIPGEYKESNFIQTTKDGFKAKKWEKILKDLTEENPSEPPVSLKNEELYNLVYNTDINKNPVVWIKREVKRKGRGFSNSFTDIYGHLIKTSEINEKSFKEALLIADNKHDVALGVFTNSSIDKIEEFEKKKIHLENLKFVKPDFEKLKGLNDKFIEEEVLLGKLKHTFLKQFNAIEKELSVKTSPESELSLAIRTIEKKIEIDLKKERDELITERAVVNADKNTIEKANLLLDKQLEDLEGYEPSEDNLLFNGLIEKVKEESEKQIDIESQLAQLKRSKFTLPEVQKSINVLEQDIKRVERLIEDFDNLLIQNISDDPEIIRMAASYLSEGVAQLDKSKLIKGKKKGSVPLTFFGDQIDVSSVEIKNLPTIKEHKETLISKNKDLAEKKIQLNALENEKGLQTEIEKLKDAIVDKNKLIEKIKTKPKLLAEKTENQERINGILIKLSDIEKRIEDKDKEIADSKVELDKKRIEKKKFTEALTKHKESYQYFMDKEEVYEINEVLNEPFEKIHEKFTKTYQAFGTTRETRKSLKEAIESKLKKDILDIKHFIREVDEEISNIAQMDKVITNLLDTLSYEIGNPTHTFLSQFEDFKTFVYKSYNKKLAEYPVSNIQNVKVKIHEAEDLIKDLERISNLRFTDELDFDNSYSDSKRSLEKQIIDSKGKPIDIYDLFTIKVEITKVTGETEEIDLSKQVQSRGTNIVLKLYLFLNVLKDLVHADEGNKIIIYVDELDAIGQKNVKHLVLFCKENNFVPIFAAPRKVEGIEKYYMVKEPQRKNANQRPKITFGEMQSFPVEYRSAEQSN